MVEPLRHRQTKGAATDMFYLMPPRHISTLPILDFPRTERMSSLLSRTDILRSDAKVGNEWGRRDWYDLPTGLALIDVDEWVQSEPGQLANFDSGAPADFAGRQTLCLHLGHTN